MIIEIDPEAGFCIGVRKAVRKAEEIVSSGGKLYSLGQMVHNKREVARLTREGIVPIDQARFRNLRGKAVLFRSHGEPPETYRIAEDNCLQVHDATCPVVKRLQSRIQKAASDARTSGTQVVLLGRESHPEVIGLKGHASGEIVVISKVNDLERIDPSRPLVIFAQTTFPAEEFRKITAKIKALRKNLPHPPTDRLIIHNTICRHVSNREHSLSEFARRHDLVVFVSDPNSSNGKALFETVRKVNPSSVIIESESEIDPSWLRNIRSVGISGSNSTPFWQLEQAAHTISELSLKPF